MRFGSDELIGAELRRLPALAAPAGGWERLAVRLDEPPARPARWLGPVGAIAASVCAVSVALLVLSARAPEGSVPAGAAAGDAVDQLMQHSQWLEATLQRLPERPAVERASTAAVIDELQNRIQRLDSELTAGSSHAADPTQQQSMWNERVRLLNSLVDVRYAEALRDSRLHVTPTGEFL
jgi:hypothetical protein